METQDADLDLFTESYFRYFREKDERDFWSWIAMDQLCHEEPIKAWDIVLHLIRLAPSKDAISWVAAGPLEDLLRTNGDEFIGELKAEINQNRRFVYALSHVIVDNEQPKACEEIKRVMEAYNLKDRNSFDIG